jgi:hypothetical protein
MATINIFFKYKGETYFDEVYMETIPHIGSNLTYYIDSECFMGRVSDIVYKLNKDNELFMVEIYLTKKI